MAPQHSPDKVSSTHITGVWRPNRSSCVFATLAASRSGPRPTLLNEERFMSEENIVTYELENEIALVGGSSGLQ